MWKVLHNTTVSGVKVLVLALGVLSLQLARSADPRDRRLARVAGVSAVASALLGLYNQRVMRLEHVVELYAWGQSNPLLELLSDAALLVALVAWAWLALTKLAPAEAGPALLRVLLLVLAGGALAIVGSALLESFG